MTETITLPENVVEAIRTGQFAFAGEAILTNYGETAAKPCYAEFVLLAESDRHPFKDMKTGRQYGQRFALIAVPLDDEEKVLPQPRQQENASKQSARLCNDERFQNFLKENFQAHDWDSSIESLGRSQAASFFVRKWCHVGSRREFDSDPVKRRQWEKLHSAYLQETGQQTERR